MTWSEIGERKAVISGVGQSQIGRRIYRDPLELTVDAALAAIEHAGLTRDDIDGVATYPGTQSIPPGFSVLVFTVEEMARSNFYNGYTYLDTMSREATDAFLAV